MLFHFILSHPRRPRGSQSGREKRRDKSFQALMEEPLGTDSHWTISKWSSKCWLLIKHKKGFLLLCPISEQFLLSCFREFVHDSYYLATVARFVHQAFLTKNEGTTDELKNVSDVISRSNSICSEKILFLTDHNVSIVNNRKFKMRQRRESKKSNSLTRQNNNFANASHFFVHFFAVPAQLPQENA